MRKLPQPGTVDELIALARSYHLDPSTWIKSPEVLLGDILRKDVVLAESEQGLTTLRYSACLEAYHMQLVPSLKVLALYEDHQKIPMQDGTYVIIDRQLPFLQETWQFESGEDVKDALERAAQSEGGFWCFDRSRLRRAHDTPDTVDEPSKFFLGIWSRRRKELWYYDAHDGEFNQEGHEEVDEHGIITVTRWKETLSR